MFIYLGRKGEIESERLYVSVSLYLLIALGWASVYTFINVIEPGSFADTGVPLTGKLNQSRILYFSLTTITTLGFGDIVAIKPAARMLSSLEAGAGILYVATTVARLVADHQNSDGGKL